MEKWGRRQGCPALGNAPRCMAACPCEMERVVEVYIAAELSDAAVMDGRCKAVQHDRFSVLRMKAWTAQTRILSISVLNGMRQSFTNLPGLPKRWLSQRHSKAYSV